MGKTKLSPKKLALALEDAGWELRVDDLKALLEQGADPYFNIQGGSCPISSALGAAIRSNDFSCMEAYVAHGVPVNLPMAEEGQTLLHVAAFNDHPEAIRWLLAHGADLHAVDARHKNTALGEAADRFSLKAASALLAAGADPNRRNRYGATPLMSAPSAHEREEAAALASLLLQAGADPNVRDPASQATALHFAARRGMAAAAKAMLSHGADVNARDASGGTPLDHALRSIQNPVNDPCWAEEAATVIRAHGGISGHSEQSV